MNLFSVCFESVSGVGEEEGEDEEEEEEEEEGLIDFSSSFNIPPLFSPSSPEMKEEEGEGVVVEDMVDSSSICVFLFLFSPSSPPPSLFIVCNSSNNISSACEEEKEDFI